MYFIFIIGIKIGHYYKLTDNSISLKQKSVLDICRQHFKPEKFYFICANVAQPGRAADL